MALSQGLLVYKTYAVMGFFQSDRGKRLLSNNLGVSVTMVPLYINEWMVGSLAQRVRDWLCKAIGGGGGGGGGAPRGYKGGG